MGGRGKERVRGVRERKREREWVKIIYFPFVSCTHVRNYTTISIEAYILYIGIWYTHLPGG